MSEEDKKHKIKVLATLERRKRILELKSARLGVNTSPEDTIEMEDLDKDIAQMKEEMEGQVHINASVLPIWWGEKLAVYKNILECLSHMQLYYNRRYSDEIEQVKIDGSFLTRLNKRSNQSYEYIERLIYIGDFLVSTNTIEALRKMMQDLEKQDREGNWMQDLEDHYSAIIECITKVREYAKADLLNG